MSLPPLAFQIGAGVLALLAVIALRGKRWAYFAVVVLGLAYFPAQAHFQLHAPKCEQILPTVQQLVPLLHNFVYVALFAGFYWISWVQFGRSGAGAFWALIVTVLAAVLFEVAEGMTAVVAVAKTVGHAKAVAAVRTPCRVRDLVPDIAGALGAALILAIWARLTKKPAYVALKPRTKAAPRPLAPAPSPRAGIPARAVLYDPPAYAPPPPPPDFSPGPTTEVTAAAHITPAEPVAPKKPSAARAAIALRLRAILGRMRLGGFLGRLKPPFQRLWALIRGHRRAILVGGFALLLVLVGAAAFLIFRMQGPAASEQAQAPPPPPPPEAPAPAPRQLQAEVEGYYEPNYQFVVFDRRFTRLTLHPDASVMFARFGTREKVDCPDARISSAAVYLRCQLKPYGLVTIDGRFPARYATSKLDMPVLSALITVTNTRGETVYRARDSFYWHVPD